jgi:hypothetical protein
MDEIAVVSTALGASPCCRCCEDELECVPGGGVNGTCRVYIAEKGGINRNVMSDLA